tara:strand:- start:3438 stop:3602 length:165 start_codon:yes stop_codon:yes gene_type:complete
MTNTSLRERFGIETQNAAVVSRIIKDTIESNLVSIEDESVGSKSRKYIPSWAFA